MSNLNLAISDKSLENNVPADDSETKKRKIRSTVAQVIASTVKNILLFSCGLSQGYPTIVIPNVYPAPENATLRLTEEEVSWFGSVSFIAIPLGSIVSGAVSEKFGRKRSMQLLYIPLLSAWIVYYYAESALALCAAAALSGITGGLLEAPVLTYISEITEPRLRGILTISTQLSSMFGSFMMYFLGSLVDWKLVSAICTTAPAVGFVALFFVPESPYWLMGQNREEDCEKALCWLRGWTTKEHVQDEYDELVREVKRGPTTTEQDDAYMGRNNRCCGCNITNYTKRIFIVPFLLMMFTFTTAQFSGVLSLMTYAVNMVNSFGAALDAYYVTAGFGFAQFTGTLVCMTLVHYTGKRTLVSVSCIGLFLFFGGAGLYGLFYLGLEKLDNGAHVQEKFQGIPDSSWFPIVCFVGGCFLSYFGIRTIPWILIGEIFPSEVRSVASGISAGMGYFIGFIANKIFFNLIAAFTLPGVFLFYATVAIISLLVYYFWLPETEGWSLLEVQQHFAGKRNLIKAGMKKANNADNVRRKSSRVPVEEGVTKL